jgi:chromate transporter
MFAVTAWTGTELGPLFIIAGLMVLLIRAWPGSHRAAMLTAACLAGACVIVVVESALDRSHATAGSQPVLLEILVFFTKAGSFVFGSGLTIVPFLEQGVVHDFRWLNDRQFLDAVAVALITPGPVVITVAFIGYLVAGPIGATMAAVGIFLPVYLFTIGPARWFQRHRDNPQLRAFASGATAAASGAIAGAVVVLARRAIIDAPTAIVAAIGLVLMLRFRLAEPLVVAGAGLVGLLMSWKT